MEPSREHTFSPAPARISDLLANSMGLIRYNANSVNATGFRCRRWVDDEHDRPTATIEWFMGNRPDIGQGRQYESRVLAAHREKLREIKKTLEEFGYSVVWGWDPETGEPDTTFIVVITKESAELDAQAEEQESEEPGEVDEEVVVQRLQTMTISLREATEAAVAVARSYGVGRDEAARRLEHQLMKAVLTAIVYGTDEPVDLAAEALSNQHLPFAR